MKWPCDLILTQKLVCESQDKFLGCFLDVHGVISRQKATAIAALLLNRKTKKKTRELGNKNQSVATLQQINTQIPRLCHTNQSNPTSLLCFGMSIHQDAATQQAAKSGRIWRQRARGDGKNKD